MRVLKQSAEGQGGLAGLGVGIVDGAFGHFGFYLHVGLVYRARLFGIIGIHARPGIVGRFGDELVLVSPFIHAFRQQVLRNPSGRLRLRFFLSSELRQQYERLVGVHECFGDFLGFSSQSTVTVK